MKNENGIRIMRSQWYKVPTGTIWGFIGSDANQESKVNDFLTSLDKIAKPTELQTGSYGYFSIAGLVVEINDSFNTSKSNIKKVVLNLTGSQASLKETIAKAKTSGLDVKFFTSDGKTY
jgi:hypothetical protein